jgi:predicted kinase
MAGDLLGSGVADPALPSDAMVMLIGPSGAGKSTWAAQHFGSDQVVSSDACRALVAGDAADQAASADAFNVLHVILGARLRRGLLTVVDATNLQAGARRTLLRYARRAGRPAVAVAFDVSLGRCLRQNAGRPGRRVPESVVRRQHAQLQATLAVLSAEGYADVRVLHEPDIGDPGARYG